MRKQTKKVLSWVLAGAMTLGLAANVNFAPASADDATKSDVVDVTSWTYGGDGDSRIQIANTWGGHAFPEELAGQSFTGIQVTFTASNVAEALKAADKESATAALCFNSDITKDKGDGPSNWNPAGAGCTDATIKEDGTYTVSYAGLTKASFANYLAVRIPDLDASCKKGENGTESVVKFSDVKVKTITTASKYSGAVDSWTYGGDGDSRIQIANTWGGHAFPEAIAGMKFNGVKVTFTASNVAEALKAAGKESATAALCFNSDITKDKGDGPSNWNPAGAGCVDATIAEDGTYSLSYAGFTTAAFANYFAVRIPDLDASCKKGENGTESVVKFSDVKVEVFGEDGEVVEPTEDPNATATPEPTEAPKAYDEALWATKGIHAYIAYQMDGTWDYRNGYKPNALGKQDTYDYIKASGDAANFKATDVLLTKDGEYTVGISGIDLTAATKYNLLSIATDLSAKTEDNPDGAYADVKLSVTSLKIDGVEVAKDLSLVQKADELYYYYPLINKWNADDKGPLFEKTDAEDLAVPENSIEITFKVTGLKAALNDLKEGTYKDPETGENVKNDTITKDDIDASEGVLPTPSTQPTVKPTVKPSEKPNVTSEPLKDKPTKAPQAPKKGNKVESGKVVYKVTKAATAKKAGTLAIVGLSKAGKKASSLSAPATVKINGCSYKVTSIGKNAFKGANAKTISLGKNIKSIPAGAFANCKKLSTLKVKAKLTKVAKKAFKGCKKTIKVKGASKKVTKANVKKLKKSGYKKFK